MDPLTLVGHRNLFNVPQTMTPSMAAPAGMAQAGNIDLGMQPHIPNEDGSISSVRSASFNDGTHEVLIPTVSQNGRLLSMPEAINQYRQTGKHLGKFTSPALADKYAIQLHNDYEQGKIKGQPGTLPMSVGPVSVQGGNGLDFFNY